MFRTIIIVTLLSIILSACGMTMHNWGTSEKHHVDSKWTQMAVGLRARGIPISDVISTCRVLRGSGYTFYAVKLTNIDTGEEHVFICEDIRKQYPRQRK